MAQSGVKNKPGVAFIVSNDYDCPTGKLVNYKLKGTHRDAEKMASVFKKLGYEVVKGKNLMYDELFSFICEAADLPYTPSYKRLVFTFSGHGVAGDRLFDQRRQYRGNASGKLCSQEGRDIEIEQIIDQFKPDKHPALGRMARLFFFDVCRGDEEDVGVPLQPRGVTAKGGNFLIPERVPKDGNILVAYSTLPNHKAYELKDGSLWMKFLSETILNQNDDIAVILTDVSSRVKEEFKHFDRFQTPQCINQLTERVNFLGESLSGQDGNNATTPFDTRTQPHFPSQTTTPPATCSSPPSAIKTPVAKLQEYCQQNSIPLPEYKEFPAVGGFYCTVTVGGKQYNGVIKSKIRDAKHSAAEVALQQLDSLSLANRGANSGSSVKELKEKYFDRKKLVFKKENYFKVSTVDGGFQCTLHIDGEVFISKKCQSKSDAENGAAKKALKHFNL